MESLLTRATAGDAEAQWELSQLYLYGRNGFVGNYKEGFEWVTKAAALQNAKAAYFLGASYANSLFGFARDDKKAIEFYEIGAQQNHGPSLNNLGWMYEHGRGVPRDRTKADEYYLKAAHLGDEISMFNIGNKYADRQNYTSALVWYHRAAKAGKKDAQPEIDRILRDNFDDVISQLEKTESTKEELRVANEELRVANAKIEHFRVCPHPDFESAMRDFEMAQRNGLV